jgi:peptidoglycan-associated lipoprotein
LQGLIETLDANETIIVALAAHTDSRDSDERNDLLSQKRAESVVDYLIQRGIDGDRLVAKGYGERDPRTLIKDIVYEQYTFSTGTILNEEYISSLPDVEIKELAHQLNRRSEFSIVSKDYVPKARNRTVITDSRVKVITNPEENILKFEYTPNGLIQADCIVNGFTLGFVYDRRTVRPTISLGSALRLLKEGAIDKDDFEGDPTLILGEGTIAHKAVFHAETLRIAALTLYDVEIQVDHQLKAQMYLGQITLGEVGDFEIDEEKLEINFK